MTSVLLLLVLQLALADRLRGHRRELGVQGGVLLAAVLFSLTSYAAYTPEVWARAESAARGAARWQLTGRGLSHSQPDRAGALLRRAESRGLYQLPTRELARLLDGPVRRPLPAHPDLQAMAPVVRVVATRDLVLVEGSVVQPERAADRSVYVVLAGGAAPRVMTTRSRAAEDSARPGLTRFRSLFVRPPPEAGDAIALLVVDGERRTLVRTREALSRAIPPSRDR